MKHAAKHVWVRAAGIAGIIAAAKALRGKIRGEPNSTWWMARALIFSIPLVYIVFVAT